MVYLKCGGGQLLGFGFEWLGGHFIGGFGQTVALEVANTDLAGKILHFGGFDTFENDGEANIFGGFTEFGEFGFSGFGGEAHGIEADIVEAHGFAGLEHGLATAEVIDCQVAAVGLEVFEELDRVGVADHFLAADFEGQMAQNRGAVAGEFGEVVHAFEAGGSDVEGERCGWHHAGGKMVGEDFAEDGGIELGIEAVFLGDGQELGRSDEVAFVVQQAGEDFVHDGFAVVGAEDGLVE